MQIAKILFIIITGAALLGGCGPSQAELAALAEQKAQAERAEREQAEQEQAERAADKLVRNLIRAVRENNAAAVILLLEEGAEVNDNAKDQSGYTALHWAAVVGAAEVAKVLIANGAEVNAKDNFGWTPLHRAAWRARATRKNAAEVAKVLIANGAEVNVKDKGESGNTPLHLASGAEVAEVLIANGAEVNAKDNDGNTPLHDAARGGAEWNGAEVAKVLIANDADVNAKNKKGETPLYVATREESAEVKKLLTDNGATF